MNTSFESLRNVWVRLLDASANVPGVFWTGCVVVVVAVDSIVGCICCVMLLTKLSEDFVRRMNIELEFETLFDEVQFRFLPLIGLFVVRWSDRFGATGEEEEEENEVAEWSHGVTELRCLQMHDVNLAVSLMVSSLLMDVGDSCVGSG